MTADLVLCTKNNSEALGFSCLSQVAEILNVILPF